MLNKPNYIERAVIDSPFIRFTWDERNVRATYEPVDERLVESLMKLSKRANCAFTIAIAEWIVYRFQPLDRDPQPLRYLEAAWAANIDLAYADEMDIVDDEWRGPVRGPISMALTFVIDALFAEEAKPNAPFDPAWAAKFARHVLSDQTKFDEWFNTCLARLQTYFPPPRRLRGGCLTQRRWNPRALHILQSRVAMTQPKQLLTFANGTSANVPAWTYGKSKDEAWKAFSQVFSHSGCSEKCIKAQLDAYHSQFGIHDGTQIKAVATSKISNAKYEAAIDESDERNLIAELLMDVDD
jgi:hypothetical protein